MRYGSRRARFNWWVANLLSHPHWLLRDLADWFDRMHGKAAVHLWGHMDDDGEGQK